MYYCYKCNMWVMQGTFHQCFVNWSGPVPTVPAPTYDQWERLVKALEKLAEK